VSDINDQIAAAYQSASQVETMARQLEARISQIPGAKQHLPSRRYGEPVDTAKIRQNLTLTGLIVKDSAELANFVGIDPGIRHRMDEEKAARELQAESLRLKTEKLAAQNAFNRQRLERSISAGINPTTGRRFGQ